MKNKLILGLTIFFTLLFIPARAQEDKNEETLPVGMEKIKVGRASEVVVPIGTKTYKKGDLVILESAGEYVARRFAEMEERLLKMEAQDKELKEKIERLDSMFNQVEQDLLNSEKGEE